MIYQSARWAIKVIGDATADKSVESPNPIKGRARTPGGERRMALGRGGKAISEIISLVLSLTFCGLFASLPKSSEIDVTIFARARARARMHVHPFAGFSRARNRLRANGFNDRFHFQKYKR